MSAHAEKRSNQEESYEKWNLCFEKAKKVVKTLELEYFSQDCKKLTLSDALYLIMPTATLGPGIPEDLTVQPWRVAEKKSENPEYEKRQKQINELLNHSMRAQMAKVPETEFSEFILSNEILAVNGLVSFYLNELGYPCSLVSGSLRFSQDKNSDGTPYVWLNIDNEYIDNVFIHLPQGQEVFFKIRHRDLYMEENLETSKRNLFFGENSAASRHTLRLFKTYGQQKNVEKYLVALMKSILFFPRVKLYDICMRDYVLRVYGKPLTDLEEKWSEQCWHCGSRNTSTLKRCSVCKFAFYCGGDCQKADWKSHKLLHDEIVFRA